MSFPLFCPSSASWVGLGEFEMQLPPPFRICVGYIRPPCSKSGHCLLSYWCWEVGVGAVGSPHTHEFSPGPGGQGLRLRVGVEGGGTVLEPQGGRVTAGLWGFEPGGRGGDPRKALQLGSLHPAHWKAWVAPSTHTHSRSAPSPRATTLGALGGAGLGIPNPGASGARGSGIFFCFWGVSEVHALRGTLPSNAIFLFLSAVLSLRCVSRLPPPLAPGRITVVAVALLLLPPRRGGGATPGFALRSHSPRAAGSGPLLPGQAGGVFISVKQGCPGTRAQEESGGRRPGIILEQHGVNWSPSP